MIRLGDVVSREGASPRPRPTSRSRPCGASGCSPRRPARPRSHACATSAIRSAANGDELVDRIDAETGVDGRGHQRARREARLIFGAVRAARRARAGARAVLRPRRRQRRDHGRRRRRPRSWASEREPRRRPAHRRASCTATRSRRRTGARCASTSSTVLAPVVDEVATLRARSSSSGAAAPSRTSRTWSAARRDADVPISLNQLTFTRDEFLPLHKQILDVDSRRAAPPRGPRSAARRSDPAGSMFLATAMELFEFDEMTISEWALARGHRPRRHRAPRPRRLVRRPARDPPCVRAGPRASLPLARGARSRRSRGSRSSSSTRPPSCTASVAEDRELLEYGALLHDIGEHVAHDGSPHATRAYLVCHGQLRGFTPEEVAAARRPRPVAPSWRSQGDRRARRPLVDEERLRRARGAAAHRRRARPRPQPVPSSTSTSGSARRSSCVELPGPRRRRARAVGRAAQARAVREGLRARPRAGLRSRSATTSTCTEPGADQVPATIWWTIRAVVSTRSARLTPSGSRSAWNAAMRSIIATSALAAASGVMAASTRPAVLRLLDLRSETLEQRAQRLDCARRGTVGSPSCAARFRVRRTARCASQYSMNPSTSSRHDARPPAPDQSRTNSSATGARSLADLLGEREHRLLDVAEVLVEGRGRGPHRRGRCRRRADRGHPGPRGAVRWRRADAGGSSRPACRVLARRARGLRSPRAPSSRTAG